MKGLRPRVRAGAAAFVGVATAAAACGATSASHGAGQSATSGRNVTAAAVSSVRNVESTLKGDLATAWSQSGAMPDLSLRPSALDAYRAAANGLAAIAYPNAAAKSDAKMAERDLDSAAMGLQPASGVPDGGPRARWRWISQL